MARANPLRVAATALVLALCGCANEPAQSRAARAAGALLTDLTFTSYTPLSTNAEIARRVLSPLTFRRAKEQWTSTHALREQAIDLDHERFVIYLPAGAPPPEGYGLLVFIAPWSEATQPKHWQPPLDRHGLIFVSAANAGNDTAVLDRRLPLALLAYENVRQRYPLDRKRIYVSGLSGGSRVAQIAALAYPDVFCGALLNAGSDPIGNERRNLPPADLFHQFQRRRVVYVTGEHDTVNLSLDRASRDSLIAWCVFDVVLQVAPKLGHEPLTAAALNTALDALDPIGPARAANAAEFARCNERIQRTLSAQLTEVAAALKRRDRDSARLRIKPIDARFGGVAAPAVLDLQVQLEQLK